MKEANYPSVDDDGAVWFDSKTNVPARSVLRAAGLVDRVEEALCRKAEAEISNALVRLSGILERAVSVEIDWVSADVTTMDDSTPRTLARPIVKVSGRRR